MKRRLVEGVTVRSVSHSAQCFTLISLSGCLVVQSSGCLKEDGVQNCRAVTSVEEVAMQSLGSSCDITESAVLNLMSVEASMDKALERTPMGCADLEGTLL